MNTTTRLKNWEISVLLALCITLLSGTWAQAKQTELSSNLVRLHVIAVSDDETEQRIKLRVRDAVLQYLSPELEDAGDAAQARAVIASRMDGIQAAAEKASAGRPVRVTLSQEYYPTRVYASFTLPAGKYESLRVILGEGQGHNWWCVVFPPLCLSAAEASKVAEAMDTEDYGIVTEANGYVLKFRLLELWGELMGTVNKEK